MSKTNVSLNTEKEPEAPVEKKPVGLKTLKDLIYLGRVERKVDISGNIFLLRSITAEDQKEMVFKILRLPEDARILYAKIISVACSVEKINGVPLENLAEDESLTETLDKKISVIKNLQVSVVNKLFKNYEEILEESNSEVNIEDIKK